MKEKLLEFVLKRLGTKVNDLRHISSEYDGAHEQVLDDIDVYLDEMKTILADIFL